MLKYKYGSSAQGSIKYNYSCSSTSTYYCEELNGVTSNGRPPRRIWRVSRNLHCQITKKKTQSTIKLDHEIPLNVHQMLKFEFLRYCKVIILIMCWDPKFLSVDIGVFHVTFLFHVRMVMGKQNNNGNGCLLDVHRWYWKLYLH